MVFARVLRVLGVNNKTELRVDQLQPFIRSVADHSDPEGAA